MFTIECYIQQRIQTIWFYIQSLISEIIEQVLLWLIPIRIEIYKQVIRAWQILGIDRCIYRQRISSNQWFLSRDRNNVRHIISICNYEAYFQTIKGCITYIFKGDFEISR